MLAIAARPDRNELQLASPALGPIERIASVPREQDMPGVRGAAEEPDAIGGAVVNLDMIDQRSPADAAESDTA